jgi:hypothetical protein
MRECARVLTVALATVAIGALLVGQAGAADVRMGGTFTMNAVAGTPGSDLLPIVGNENSWTILLHGVEFECAEERPERRKFTSLYASSFEFEFFGPDAEILNTEVAQQLTQGGLDGGGYFEVSTDDPSIPGIRFHFYIWPDVPSEGAYWEVDGPGSEDDFPLDGDGCPIVGAFELDAYQTALLDRRDSNAGNIIALNASNLWLQITSPVEHETWGTVKALYR